MNSLLVVHDQNQDADLDFWRIVVPDNPEIKEHIARELHATPYSAHPGIQRTIARVRRSFYWKGILGDVRQFMENCPVCQMGKSDHTLAKGKATIHPDHQRTNGVKSPLILRRISHSQLITEIQS